MTKNWHNGGLLCIYCSGERVPDFANAKSRVLVYARKQLLNFEFKAVYSVSKIASTKEAC